MSRGENYFNRYLLSRAILRECFQQVTSRSLFIYFRYLNVKCIGKVQMFRHVIFEKHSYLAFLGKIGKHFPEFAFPDVTILVRDFTAFNFRVRDFTIWIQFCNVQKAFKLPKFCASYRCLGVREDFISVGRLRKLAEGRLASRIS